MLFSGCPRQWLEPVAIVGTAVLRGPILHGGRHLVGNRLIERFVVLSRLIEPTQGGRGQSASDVLAGEGQNAVVIAKEPFDISYVLHGRLRFESGAGVEATPCFND